MFERTTPRFFDQGPSPAAKLLVCGALAVFLMVADSRFQVIRPVREAVATVIYPLQWLMLQPVLLYRHSSRYFQSLDEALVEAGEAQAQALLLASQANEANFLKLENEQLRSLLGLRDRAATASTTAEVIYETPDPYTNRLTIDKGRTDGIREGAPVLDSYGVIGQVTRVYPFTSEVRFVSDREQTVPVMNMRTGLRMIAFGEAVARPSGGMEVRFVPTGTDIQEGDVLVTSGIDGYYPAGLPVGTVSFVETHHDAPFARIYVEPAAHTLQVRYVVVINPVGAQGADGPEPPEAVEPKAEQGVPATRGRNR